MALLLIPIMLSATLCGLLPEPAAAASHQRPLAGGCPINEDEYQLLFNTHLHLLPSTVEGIKRRFPNSQPHHPSWKEMHDALYPGTVARGLTVYTEYKKQRGALPEAPAYPWSHARSHHLDWFIKVLGEDPKLMVEVGSFVGNSARVWGEGLKALNNGAVLIACDTWTGALNSWMDDELAQIMSVSGGEPRIYERFMDNIIAADLTAIVLPWRVASSTAARGLSLFPVLVDILYLDAAHEYGETFMELVQLWKVVRPGGVLAGDDYKLGSVRHDVDLFMRLHPGLELMRHEDQFTWAIRKPFNMD